MPCAACKILRRRCTNNCIFLPYFSPAEPEKFAAVHRIFGASNISKLLQVNSSDSNLHEPNIYKCVCIHYILTFLFPFHQEIPVNDRDDAVISMVYEAMARVKDPVYGCVGLIASLQKHIFQLQSDLNTALEEILTLRIQLSNASSPGLIMSPRAHISGMEMVDKNLYNLLNDTNNNFTNPFDVTTLLLEPSSQESEDS